MFDRILLPLDISEMPEIVIPYAEELAGKFASEIILYYVRAKDHAEVKNLTLDYLDRAAETIKQHVRNIEKKEITITTITAEGEPAQSICELVNKNKTMHPVGIKQWNSLPNFTERWSKDVRPNFRGEMLRRIPWYQLSDLLDFPEAGM